MEISTRITTLEFDKSFYRPGEPVRLTVHLRSEVEGRADVRLDVALSHLAETVDHLSQPVRLEGGAQAIDVTLSPPTDAPRGYGLDVRLESESGAWLASGWGAFDVLERWTQSPRYGFLSDFPPNRSGSGEALALLTRYHLNGLQFYDWMYRHEHLLTSQDPYTDLLGRQLSRATVEDLIRAAHQRNIAAMPYTAVYGASLAFYQQHPDWALLNARGEPALFGQDFMAIMDPRPGSPWTAHLLDQFDRLLEQTAFDGIHLDQYGDPKEGFDAQGRRYDLAEPLAAFIDAAHARVQAHRPEGTVVFNAVANWPIEAVAPAGQAFVYIEVWPPYDWFVDLHQVIVGAQRLGGGKPVVLAAYLDPAHVHNVLLADAIIFASGGGHIELGEGNGMLADPYFPNYRPISPELAAALRRYYDFAVRYQDAIGPRTQDAAPEFHDRLQVVSLETGEVINTAANAVKNKVWPIVRNEEGRTAISLVNLLGLERPDWRQPLASAPQPTGPLRVSIDPGGRIPARVWLASPDGEDLSARQLDFQREDALTFEVPALLYWDLIVVEWEE